MKSYIETVLMDLQWVGSRICLCHQQLVHTEYMHTYLLYSVPLIVKYINTCNRSYVKSTFKK